MNIQPFSADKVVELSDIYYRAVHAIDSRVYSAEQKNAWAPPPDYPQWAKRFELKAPYMAVIGERVAGFIELDADGHIDCLYVDPDFQGQGVAAGLYQHLYELACQQGLKHLYVEASRIARPFFERRGFTLLQENIVHRQGIRLLNYRMEKHLSGSL